MVNHKPTVPRIRGTKENEVLSSFRFKRPVEPPTHSRWDMSGFYNRPQPDYPLDPLAFRGFMFSYRQKGDPRTKGRRKDPLLWAEQLIEGIQEDNIPLMRECLSYKFADINSKIHGGHLGAPYHYARASFFTEEQVQTLLQAKRERLKKFAHDSHFHFGKREWADMEEPLTVVSTYMTPLMAKIRRGDTALCIALRLLRLQPALFLLQEDIDPLTVNEDEESPAHLLREQYEAVMEELDTINKLEYKRHSAMMGGLTDQERERMKKASLWELRRHEIHQLADILHTKAQAYLQDVTTPLKAKAARCTVEDFRLTAQEEAELAREAFLLDYVRISKEIFDATDDSEVPEEFDPAAQEAKRINAIVTRIQSWFRGSWYRLCVDRRRKDKAAYLLQLFFKFMVAWSKQRKRLQPGRAPGSHTPQIPQTMLDLLGSGPASNVAAVATSPAPGIKGLLKARPSKVLERNGGRRKSSTSKTATATS